MSVVAEGISEHEIEALSTAVLTMDGARRVAWAKAFAALRRIDGLEEEIRQLQDERKYMRRAYSRLLGFLAHVPIERTEVFNEEFDAHLKAERQMRQADAWDHGKSLGRRHSDIVNARTEDEAIRARLTDQAWNEAYVELFRRGTSEGHDIDRMDNNDQMDGWVRCSCGASFVDSSDGSSGGSWWLAVHHLIDALHGQKYWTWKKQAKRAVKVRVDELMAERIDPPGA